MPDSSQQDTNAGTTATKEETRPDLSSQAGFDQAFGQLAQQIPQQGQGVQELLHMQSQANWRLIEDHLRTAREVSQYQTLFTVRQQITQEAAQQALPYVINFLRQNPHLVQSMISQGQSTR